MAEKDRSDPFPNLGQSAISRRFAAFEPKPVEKIKAAHTALAKAEKKAKALSKPKPKKAQPKGSLKPWEAEGISRMTWYRNKSKDKAK